MELASLLIPEEGMDAPEIVEVTNIMCNHESFKSQYLRYEERSLRGSLPLH